MILHFGSGMPLTHRECKSCVRARGLTLVELLIAISLFSLIGSSTMELVRSTWILQHRFDQMAATSLARERALEEMAQDLARMQPLYRVAFIGGPQMLQFARLESSAGGGPVWRRIVYQTPFSASEMALIRETFDVTEANGAPIERRVVLPRLNSLRIEFGWKHPQTNLIIWQTPWPELTPPALPGLIRVTAEEAGSDPLHPVRFERIIRNPAGLVPTMEPP